MITVLLILGGIYLALLVGKAVLAVRYARAHPPSPPRASFSDVTILQPILGGDPQLAQSLAANLIVLRGARFVWLLDAEDRAGWEAARLAQARAPTAHLDLISCPPPPPNKNPKVFKLARAEPDVVTQYLMVLDDDTRLSATGLTTLLDALLDHDVATGLPSYLPGDNLPSNLVAQFVNNESALTYLPLLGWGQPVTINGMAYAFATARWRALGGFSPLAHRLTDDLAVANRIRAAGGRIFQSAVPHVISTSVRDWRQYAKIMHRWFVFALLLVRAQPARWRIAIVALHGLPPILLWSVLLCVIAAPRWPGAVTLAGLLLIRIGLRMTLQRLIFGHGNHGPLTSLAAELAQPIHLMHALLSKHIHWRSRVIDVRGDDAFSRV